MAGGAGMGQRHLAIQVKLTLLSRDEWRIRRPSRGLTNIHGLGSCVWPLKLGEPAVAWLESVAETWRSTTLPAAAEGR